MRLFKRLIFLSLMSVALLFVALESGLSYSARGRLYSDITKLPYNKTALLLTTSKQDTTRDELLPYYQHRVDAAVLLYKRQKVSYILVSGANLAESTVFLMKQDLMKQGIPGDRIFLDTCGYNTFESIVRCRVLYDADSVTIVSQKHHCERALYMAAHKGLNAIGYVAPGDAEKIRPGVILHEFLGRIKMFWLLGTSQQPRQLHECPI